MATAVSKALTRETWIMQTLDIDRPDMPDLQFTLLVTALCTSRLTALNIPDSLRTTIFDRCWVLIHDSPPPRRLEDRVLDLRPWTEVTLDAMVNTIRGVFWDAGIRTLTWDHAPGDSTLTGAANLLVCPNIDSANILYNVLKTTTSGGVTVGPILMGTAGTAYILTPASTVRRVLNMTALAVASSAAGA